MVEVVPDNLIFNKLSVFHPLDEEDRSALKDLRITRREYDSRDYIVRDGSVESTQGLILGGFAFRHVVTRLGARCGVGFVVPGEFTVLANLLSPVADHNVQALTAVRMIEFGRADLEAIAMKRPRILRSITMAIGIEGAMLREAVVSIARMDAAARVARLLCDFEARLGVAGLASQGYDLPMSQEHIGDATGLTSVHVNRVLMQLERDRLITRIRRKVVIVDWAGLKARAEYQERHPRGTALSDQP